MDERKIFKKLNRLKAFCNLPKNASWNNYKVLKTALQCEQKDVVLFLLSAGCQVNNKSADVIENTPLHYAVKLEDTELIQTLISKGALLTCQNQKGDTPLHVAAMSRNTVIVDILLHYIEQTQYVNPVNNFGLTHMHIACMRNKPDIVEKFLKNRVRKNISIRPDSSLWPGYTPLHFAVEFCCLEVVQLLTKYKANTEYQDAEGTDPCHLAYQKYQNASIIDYFLSTEEGSYTGYWDIDESFEAEESDIKSNFLVACLGGHVDIITKYLKHGADVNAKAYSFCIFQGDTPLHCAIRSESVDAVKFLLKYNDIDINSVNDYGMTPLHAAFYQQQSDFEYAILNIVYSAYDFIKEGNVVDTNGLSYFHIICAKGDTNLINHFLKNGADVNSQIDINARYFAGCTPLYFALRNYETDAVELLLRNGGDITIIFNTCVNGRNPCEFIISMKWVEIIELVAQTGLNLNTIKGEECDSAYHILISYTSGLEENENMRELSKLQEITKILYKYGCNINKQDDDDGNTPLHISQWLSLDAYKYIQTLLDLGADINIENTKGKTPLMMYRNLELSFPRHPLIHFHAQYKVFLGHVEKLKTIRFYVSEKNRLFIEQLFEQQAQIDPNKKCLDMKYYSGLRKQFENEIDKMKQIKIANYSSLYDILFADANQMAFHCNCKTFLDIMNLNDFDDQFPNYGYLLKLQFKKGNERKAVLGPAKDALKFILKRELPDFCSEKVFSYLIDDDLKTLIQTTTWTNMNSTKKILKPQRTRKVRKIPNELLKLFERDEDVDMLND